ncbi:MAG: type I restriction endonuclease subunit R [Candidatus Caenarcaniphilales bacterium]|nr:type I restriction endonuclease subunit R [Candidatus Caenarcaniphilales bacterium]
MGKEQEIEGNLISKLQELKYTYREDIRDKASLDANFRAKFEELNKVNLSDAEFKRLMDQIISPDVFETSKHLREINTFIREDGTPLHYTLVNIKDWCKNTFEVINQLRINTDNSHHRYDVILLINGVPCVQIELKTLDISPRRAMQQIVDYKNEAGNGYGRTLMCFMQMFIVSNSSETYYFANNNDKHFNFDADERFLPVYQHAAKDNRKINRIDEFASGFLSKCTLGQMISKYMVLVACEQKILLMRPYQIYAVKAIVDCIKQNAGNGYIWHTTGSGKTLTSFKASTLLKYNPDIEKCLFVVDRKDLDRQTREEFNRFQNGCVEENTNTETLVKRLLSRDYADKVIVTTIQKLGLALDPKHKQNYKKRLEPLKDKRMVFIFDECHRSQFGDNHKAIKEFFPQAQLFGFTGTPIFDKNSNYKFIEGDEASKLTTDDVFQNQLHAYTITNAIDDGNVLRFHVDYFKAEGKTELKQGESLAKKAIIEAILKKHNAATNNKKFNAVLATAKINDAIEYYKLFKKIQKTKLEEDSEYQALNIACVFSPPAEGNKDIKQYQEDLPQEKEDNKEAPEEKKAALRMILADYNQQYKTNHSVSEFDSYYQDVQKRIKDQQYPNSDLAHSEKIDIVIVVDMLLTGFDSKYLNTLYVDKNLKYHGLIQAFSRTNRVLNDTKPYGNIMDFRYQEDAVNEAVAMFSGEAEKERAKEIWLVDKAPVVIEKLDEAVHGLINFMESQGLDYSAADVSNLKGDAARSEFVKRFKDVQRYKVQLDQYTDLTEEDKSKIDAILPEEDLKSMRGAYLSTAQRLRAERDDKNEIISPEIQELDFEFVLFSSSLIDYDYIMELVARSTQTGGTEKEEMSRDQIVSLLCSDAKFMDKREDIIAYMDTLKTGVAMTKEEVIAGLEEFLAAKNSNELTQIANKYEIKEQAMKEFVDLILLRKIFDDELLTDLLAPKGLGWKERTKVKLELMKDLIPLLKKQANGREISGLSVYE